MWINDKNLVLKTEFDIRIEYPDIPMPDKFSRGFIDSLGLKEIQIVAQPNYDPLNYQAVELVPMLDTLNNIWYQQWSIVELTQDERVSKEKERQMLLWQAAHDYEYQQISGSALSLLTLGVLQAKPKSLSIQAWIKSIWLLYYSRKALLSTDYNFTVVGNIPYSVPELMEELGV